MQRQWGHAMNDFPGSAVSGRGIYCRLHGCGGCQLADTYRPDPCGGLAQRVARDTAGRNVSCGGNLRGKEGGHPCGQGAGFGGGGAFLKAPNFFARPEKNLKKRTSGGYVMPHSPGGGAVDSRLTGRQRKNADVEYFPRLVFFVAKMMNLLLYCATVCNKKHLEKIW